MRGQTETPLEKLTRERKILSYQLDDASRALHDQHRAEQAEAEERATKRGGSIEEVILGQTQVDPLAVLAGPIAASAAEAKAKRNPTRIMVNSSPFTFIARLGFLRVSPAYLTKEKKEDMGTDQVLVKWCGVSSGVSS